MQTVLNELPRYEEFAGRTRVLHDQGNAKFLDEHQAADEIMRTKLLPAIDELDRSQSKMNWTGPTKRTRRRQRWPGNSCCGVAPRCWPRLSA